MSRLLAVLVFAAGVVLAPFAASTAEAHPHRIKLPNGSVQILANGQDHPGFGAPDSDGFRRSCAGELEPAASGPAGYGLEVAHHGPDAEPGKADGCYTVYDPTGGDPPPDNNPAID